MPPLLSQDSYELALAITPKISASFSLLGSSMIVRDVWRKQFRRQGRKRSNGDRHHRRRRKNLPMTIRVVLNMSVADLGSSFAAHFLSTWMVPKGTEGAALTAGNQITCSAQAYFYELFVYSGLWSTSFLAVTFWLIICKQVPEAKLQQWKYQFPLIGLPWIFGLLNATPKILRKDKASSFNSYWWCELYEGDEFWDNGLDQIAIGVCFLMILFSMFALSRFVYLKERRIERYGPGSLREADRESVSRDMSTSLDLTSPGSSEEPQQRRRRQQESRTSREKTLKVTYQGLFYILTWLLVVIPVIIVSIKEEELAPGYFIFWASVFPLQGFINSLIYFRPTYVAARQREPTLLAAILRVLDLGIPGSNDSTSNQNNSSFVSRLSNSIRQPFRYGTTSRRFSSTMTNSQVEDNKSGMEEDGEENENVCRTDPTRSCRSDLTLLTSQR